MPPVTLAGCPDKCGNVNIPYPFGTRDGCFRLGFFVVCNHTFNPPRPFIDTDDKTREIDVEDLYYLTSEDGTTETKPSLLSAWPIELADVSLSVGKARVLGAFSYECRLNETHHSVRRQSITFSLFGQSPFLLSADDNVLMGISMNEVAEQTSGPVMIQKQAKYYNSGYRGGRSCSYAMIVEKTWYNFLTVDLDSDAFLRRNATRVVPIVADFTMVLEPRTF